MPNFNEEAEDSVTDFLSSILGSLAARQGGGKSRMLDQWEEVMSMKSEVARCVAFTSPTSEDLQPMGVGLVLHTLERRRQIAGGMGISETDFIIVNTINSKNGICPAFISLDQAKELVLSLDRLIHFVEYEEEDLREQFILGLPNAMQERVRDMVERIEYDLNQDDFSAIYRLRFGPEGETAEERIEAYVLAMASMYPNDDDMGLRLMTDVDPLLTEEDFDVDPTVDRVNSFASLANR